MEDPPPGGFSTLDVVCTEDWLAGWSNMCDSWRLAWQGFTFTLLWALSKTWDSCRAAWHVFTALEEEFASLAELSAPNKLILLFPPGGASTLKQKKTLVKI